jgi:hypothetical protein
VNIQQTIIDGLRQRLYHHQYIVLPEFGGFVLKPRPAHFSSSGMQLLPPSKTVTFNSQLRQNDGILTAWLQKKAGCSADEAYAHLKDFAGYCSGVLQNRRRLSLPGIGFFHLDFENNICFEPLADHNFLASSFGLTPLSLLQETTIQTTKSRRPVFEDRQANTTISRRSATSRARAAVLPAILTAFAGVLILLLISVSDFRGELRAALSGGGTANNYAPFKYAPLVLDRPEPAPALVSDANGIAVVTLGDANIRVDVGLPEYKSELQSGYEIILGCFSVPSNAKKMVRQLGRKEINARISKHTHRGMAVVTYGAFENKKDAQLVLATVQKVIPEAWIKGSD